MTAHGVEPLLTGNITAVITSTQPLVSVSVTLLASRPSSSALEAVLAASSGDDTAPDEAPRFVHLESFPANEARYGELRRPLPSSVWVQMGVQALWSHQAEAIDLARDGTSVVVSTGTASGKSLCYQAPIAEAALDPIRPGTALLIFPTKALAHDQLRSLWGYGFEGLVPAAYDGDAGPEERTWARANANALLTNPEMLHAGILPHHRRWATFLMRLRYVVVDELHVLRGIFGSNVAHVLRRLRRLCASYGSYPTFLFSSATIGEPAELASELCGLEVRGVGDDGSPRGERLVALCNPKDAHGSDSGPRASANSTAARLLARLVSTGHQTIVFCRSRKGTELVAAEARRRLPAGLADSVRAYRGGYLADERRDLEAELSTGTLRGVVATTALELGVDIGGLDACVLDGYPGTVASLWQQAGRAGRGGKASLAVLVAGDDQLDQWLMAHPTELFTRPAEPAVINPANPTVLGSHLACAAFEQPLSHADAAYWPDDLDEGVRRLVLDDELRLRRRGRRREPTAVWARRGWPANGVGLRSGSAGEFRIVTRDDSLVGTVDRSRAFGTVHPGAVYLHQGAAYRVVDLEIDDRLARVEPTGGDEYTQARTEIDIRLLEAETDRPVGAAALTLGTVEVTSVVSGYRRRDSRTGELLESSELDLPPTRLTTRALWYTVDRSLLEEAGVAPCDGPGALHAVEHAAIGILPLFAICDRWDVGGMSTMLQLDTGLPTVVIYDGYQGGVGIADLAYSAADRHLEVTRQVIDHCGCADGCPSCVQSPKCGNFNEPLNKAGAAAVLAAVLD